MNRKNFSRSSSKLMIASLIITQLLSGVSPLFSLNVHAEGATEPTTIVEEMTPTPTATPTNTPEPTVVPDPTVEPTLEPTLVIEEPTVVPTIEPTPETSVTPIVEPTPQIDYGWVVNNSIAETKTKVELGVTYVFPLDDKVTLKFNSLPDDLSLRTSLKVEQLKISELNLPEGTNASGEYAYDITTGMTNGTFTYDLTLPKAIGETAGISYIENLGDTLIEIESSNIFQGNDSVGAVNIDHFSIYFPTCNKGDLKIVKNSIGGNDTFNFSSNVPNHSSFSITTSTSSNPKSVTFDDLSTSNSYSVSENTLSGWDKTSVICDEGTPTHIIIKKDHTTTCTFLNTKQAKLTLEKIVNNDHGGTALATAWTLKAEGTTKTISGIMGNVAVTNAYVPAGAYTLSELNGPSGYTPSAWSCTGATVVNNIVTLSAGAVATCKVTNDNIQPQLIITKIIVGGTALVSNFPLKVGSASVTSGVSNSFNAGEYTVTEINNSGMSYTGAFSGACNSQGKVTLAVGDTTKECFITNTRDTGSLKVSKLTDTNSDGTFETTDSASNSLGFRWGIGTATDNTFGTTLTGLETGNFSVKENSVVGYHFVGWYNSDTQGKSCTNLNGTTLPISVAVTKGSTTNIVLCNHHDTGNLLAKKTVDDQTSLSQWSFSLDNTNWISANATTGIVDFGKKLTGSPYTIYEKGPNSSDYQLGSVTGSNCTKNTSPVGSATANIEADKETLCVFNNLVNKVSITVIKDAIKDSSDGFYYNITGGHTESFTLEDNGGSVHNTWSVNGEKPGTFTITETLTNSQKENWKLTKLNCVSSRQNINNPDNSVTFTLNPGESITCTFTNTKYSTLNVYKFNDLNGNGIRESQSEPYLPNWSMTLFKEDNCKQSNITTSTGSTGSNGGAVLFNKLLPGKYSVKEASKNGWVSTSEDGNLCKNVELIAGDSKDLKFGNFQLVDISGMKYEDRDNNKQKNGDEKGIEDWKITLNKWNEQQHKYVEVDSTKTDEHGEYKFENVGPGKYQIVEEERDGWVAVNPKSGEYSDITPTSGRDVEDKDFGNVSKAELTLVKVTNPSKIDKDFEVTLKLGRTTIPTEDINAHEDPVVLDKIQQGVYSLSEEKVTGWEKESIKCSYAKDDHDERQNNQSSGSTNLNPESLNIKPGDHIICIFTNNKLAELTLVKVTNPSKFDQDFEVKITKSHDEHDGYSQNGSSNDNGHDDGISTEINASEHPVKLLLKENKYDVSEYMVNGWVSGGAKCTSEEESNDWHDNDNRMTGITTSNDNNDKKDDVVTKTVDLKYGDKVTCTFTNNKLAELTLVKKTVPTKIDQDFKVQIDKVRSQENDEENDNHHDALSILGHDKGLSATINATDHKPTKVLLDEANWALTEEMPKGWELGNVVCKRTESEHDNHQQDLALTNHDEENNKPKDLDPSNLKIEYGMNITCTFTNNKLATLKVINFNDVNGDGVKDHTPDQFKSNRPFSLMNDEALVVASGTTDGHGEVEFKNLGTDNYELLSTLAPNWNYTKIQCSNNHGSQVQFYPEGATEQKSIDLALNYGDNFVCNYGEQIPLLLIDKINDALGDQIPGESIGFTITLCVPVTEFGTCDQDESGLTSLRKHDDHDENPFKGYIPAELNDVIVSDVLPTGINYNGDGESTVPLHSDPGVPVYGQIGLWELVNPMNAGDFVTLHYTAKIRNDVGNGLYKDLAWASATTGSGQESKSSLSSLGYGPLANGGVVYAVNAHDESTNFVNTGVNVFLATALADQSVVLGTSTVRLPRTGLDDMGPIMVAFSLIFIGGGISIAAFLWEKRRNFIKLFSKRSALRLATFISIFLGLGVMFGTVGLEKVQAAPMSINLEQPGEQYVGFAERITNKSIFNIAYVAGSTGGITVDCKVQKPGDGTFSTFFSTSGNAGECKVTSAVTTVDGLYTFKAVTNEGAESIVKVEIDRTAPLAPTSYSKVHPVSCKDIINFGTLVDKDAKIKIDIFRGESTTFIASPSTLLQSIEINSGISGSSAEFALPDCSKTYYYATQSVDFAGNRSTFVGDTGINVVYYTPIITEAPATGIGGESTDGTGTGTNGTGTGANGTGAGTGANVTPTTNPDGTKIDTNVTDGLVAGATDNADQQANTNNNLLIIFIVIGAVILAGFIFEIKLKKPTV